MTFEMLAERRARGETIVDKKGCETVHGRVLAAEFLAEYDALLDEHNTLYRTTSPFRSDYAEREALIDADLLDNAENLAYAIKQWQDDAELEQWHRDQDVNRAAEIAEWEIDQ